MSVEGWSGVELPLAGLTPTLSMRNTLSVDYPHLVALAADTPLPPLLLPTDWVTVNFLYSVSDTFLLKVVTSFSSSSLYRYSTGSG